LEADEFDAVLLHSFDYFFISDIKSSPLIKLTRIGKNPINIYHPESLSDVNFHFLNKSNGKFGSK